MAGRHEADRRASDEDRDRALATLRDAAADGRLSIEAFVLRVDALLRAEGRREIAELIGDVTSGQSIGDRVIRRVTSTSDFLRRLQWSWRRPWLPLLTLPADSNRVQTIGRSPDCDLVVSDPTVSRRHAQLRPRQQGWELADLGSMNGTRLNGWRIGVAQALRPGDVVSFGGMSFAVVDAPIRSQLESATQV